MRRLLAILKYVPAVLCGLLVVTWVVALSWAPIASHFLIGVTGGELVVGYARGLYGESGDLWVILGSQVLSDRPIAGRLSWEWVPPDYYYLRLPFPFLMTLLTPFAIGSLTRFRFLLWSYFAWTALVAAELAYYLR